MDNVSIGVVIIAPKTSGTQHVREVKEILVVLQGIGRIVTDAASVEIEEGQVAIVPPGVRHYHENPDKVPLRQLWIFAPSGPKRAIRAWSGGEDV